MTVQDETTSQSGINLTAKAATKVSSLLEQEGRDDLRLRIAVQPGGCSGLRYQLYFDERQADGDIVREFSGVNGFLDFGELHPAGSQPLRHTALKWDHDLLTRARTCPNLT